MKYDVITLFPEMISSLSSHSILKRAAEKKIISINAVNPRDFSTLSHKRVDDTPFGGGAGMVLIAEPFMDAFNSIEKPENACAIILTPQGKPFNQAMAEEFSKYEQITLICGHYEGFDERIRTLTNAIEVSIGDFVMTGGELGALCLIDATARLLEGTIGKEESHRQDSFSDGLLEHPQYTKPREYNGLKVPDILLSGNHKEIELYRRKQQLITTLKKRPDLFLEFKNSNPSKQDLKLIEEIENQT